jgi:hypothetical protein
MAHCGEKTVRDWELTPTISQNANDMAISTSYSSHLNYSITPYQYNICDSGRDFSGRNFFLALFIFWPGDIFGPVAVDGIGVPSPGFATWSKGVIMASALRHPNVQKSKQENQMIKKKKKNVPVHEQYSNLQEMCRNVVHELTLKGIKVPDTTITVIGDALPDAKTGAMVVNALAPVSFLLTRFSGLQHWFQRKTFHHTRDPIYQRLIIAILKGYYVPPLRVAAVANTGLVADPNMADDWTLIDGLQRTTCYIIAVLMAALGEDLVEKGCLDESNWIETFKSHAASCNVEQLLARQQQMEVFYKIGHAGVLHFMLLLNGAQRQMNAKIQLELMNIPLIKLLQEGGIQLAKEQERATDNKLDRRAFKGSDLIVAVQGYLEKNPQVITTDEKEAFLSDEREYLAPVEDMAELIEALKLVTGPLHKALLIHHESTVLSEGEVFTTALMAAAGKYVEMTDFPSLVVALRRLVSDIEADKDPLDLDTYTNVYRSLKSGKGRKIRSIICASFLEYFRGNCKVLGWEENSRVYD